ncbi:hypothetical protein TorRG33x02_039640 [Trema orientale]|uniref:TOD1/MUCI70 glycosyltransferase-like domain-containing protein n=1 Tax=Trema orientale TaxID=63057 RepID=A0A2P5FQV0_TREOI|nr:hypothetical protein TorRG33x02_039640 [Trema orientale]
MGPYRQSGTERLGSRAHDHHHNHNGVSDHVTIGVRSGSHGKPGRTRRSGRPNKGPIGASIGGVIVVLSLVLVLTVLFYYYISKETSEEVGNYHDEDDDSSNDLDFLANVTRTETYKVLKFGKGSVVHGRDSRDWDRDDRRRDDDYNEDVVEHSRVGARDEGKDSSDASVKVNNFDKKSVILGSRKDSDGKGVGLYNEAGRNELKMYEAEYEASLKNSRNSFKEDVGEKQQFDDEHSEKQDDVVDSFDEYDDGIDYHDARGDEYDDSGHDKGGNIDIEKSHYGDDRETDSENNAHKVEGISTKSLEEDSSEHSRNLDEANKKSRDARINDGQSSKKSRSDSKRKGKRRKFSGSSCEIKFADSTTHLIEPLESQKFARFSLQYTEFEDKPNGLEHWEPRFAGHQSLQEREDSFLAHDQKISCGFIKGPKGSSSTGFDLAEDDANYISRCHIAVISCIFGNSDRLRTPTGKTVTRMSRKNVCFVMFIDEITLEALSSEGQTPDRMGFIGLWRIVVVKNLPYTDMRRVGKIPKLVPHRLFPSARYSIWLDSKLRLQLDPMLILEYFLWRKDHEYAISNHYDRHCVWEEVLQNKRLNKYNHTIIDQQFEFYQADGLTRFNAADPEKLLPSNVPEGSFIIRAHTPMSNLFSCLWFNEVDRFTPRDQLSFAYTYQKLRRMNPGKPFHLNMFKDCERRAIAKLYHHRSEEKRNIKHKETE